MDRKRGPYKRYLQDADSGIPESTLRSRLLEGIHEKARKFSVPLPTNEVHIYIYFHYTMFFITLYFYIENIHIQNIYSTLFSLIAFIEFVFISIPRTHSNSEI